MDGELLRQIILLPLTVGLASIQKGGERLRLGLHRLQIRQGRINARIIC